MYFLELFGANDTLITVKCLEDFPLMYKEKLFKPQEMKPLDLVKTELGDNEIDEDNDQQTENVLQELGLNEEDFIDNGMVDDDDEDEEEEVDKKDDKDFKVNDSAKDKTDEITNGDKSKKIKKRSPKTCEKCHKTYNTQTQFRIHQRDAWRCPGKPEPKWLRIVKGKDYYCLHPDCCSDGINGPLFPRRNKYWLHLREKHWNREVFVSYAKRIC